MKYSTLSVHYDSLTVVVVLTTLLVDIFTAYDTYDIDLKPIWRISILGRKKKNVNIVKLGIYIFVLLDLNP